MSAEETIEKRLEKLAQVIAPDDKFAENVMSRIDTATFCESNRINKLKKKLIIGRLLTNRLTKFAAAAAVIALAIFMSRSDESAVWADICKAFEKVNCVHMIEWGIMPNRERIKGNECWVKKPNMFRDDNSEQLTIDNGVEKLVLRKRHKTAQLSDSEQDRYPQADSVFAFVAMLRTQEQKFLGRKPILVKVPTESTHKVLVYHAHYDPSKGSVDSPKKFKMWVDANTLLVQRMLAPTGEDNPKLDMTLEYVFDYEDVADEMFLLDVPDGYKELPRKQRAIFSGQVIDESGEPVSDAEIYISALFVDVHGRTDTKGEFILKSPVRHEKVRFPIFVRAFREDEPDRVAWTVLTDPEVDKELAGGIPICENVQFNVDQNASSGPDKCLGAGNIVIRMEPALQITGTLTDKAGNPITGGLVSFPPVWLNKYKDGSFVKFAHSLDIGVPVAVTDSQGRYILNNLPKFAKGFRLPMKVKAQGYVTGNMGITLDGKLLQEAVDCSLFKGGVTIKGLVTNTAGEPLPGYIVKHTVDGKALGEVHCVTESGGSQGTYGHTGKDGEFELINCPAMEGLAVTATGVSKPPNWDFWMKNWKMSAEFVYYNEKTIHIGYQQGKKEYYVEITLDDPDTTIEVEIKDTSGNDLSGLWVTLQSDDLLSKFEAKTDENGKCIFHNLPWAKNMKLTINPAMKLSRGKKLTKDEKQYLQKLQKYTPVIWEPIELSENVKKYKVDATLSESGKLAEKTVFVHELEN